MCDAETNGSRGVGKLDPLDGPLPPDPVERPFSWALHKGQPLNMQSTRSNNFGLIEARIAKTALYFAIPYQLASLVSKLGESLGDGGSSINSRELAVSLVHAPET